MSLTETAKKIVNDVAKTQRESFQEGKARISKVTDAPPSRLYPAGIDAYRDIVKHNLKSQLKLGDKILDRVTALKGFPPPVKETAERLQGLAHKLADSQEQLTDRLCDILVKAYPAATMKTMGEALDVPAAKIREATDKALALEKQWVGSLLGPLGRAPKKSPSRAKRTAPKKSPSRAKQTAPKKTTRKSSARKPVKATRRTKAAS